MLSVAARGTFKREAYMNMKDEIEKTGFRIDTESSASTIPVLNYPNGIKGTPVVAEKKIYPNDPCPCGSGKKYKKCCGRK